ncbi:polyphenol oxidase family protein [Nocardioides sp. ChNu-153]|uniref:polyphenol oxidase family protein n=1 Tax=unclassified Nocardioides TaxID=2615069 RepID=UPI0024070675|nr:MULTISPECIES: polyphenol oxidase family protein [unclassified Nocardioides]MDF9716561.1 polyphenol oxidase family protein [Nocardioides sp. ChNu-99]MDN7120902.1 polyphenol oxidase family protein [Nocardioides sp. ChNu-153]
MFVFRERVGRVEVAFTSARHDARPLNLALPGTPPAAAVSDVRADLEAVRTELGARSVRGMRQVHGATVAVAAGALDAAGEPPEADGIVTTEPGVALLVRVADCVPVLLADPAGGAVAAAHAGREGVRAGVVTATVAALRAAGADEVRAWVGPHVCGRCYEVPAALRDEVARAVPAAAATTSWGTPALDLGAAVRAQLTAAGVDEVTELGACTMEDAELWSHRRDGAAAGRLAGLVQVVA